MAYATPADMQARFPAVELIELSNPNDLVATAIDPATLAVALDDATALIDALVADRAVVPLSPVPALMVALCCDLARYRLYSGGAPDEVEKRYERAVSLAQTITLGG